MFKIMTNDVDPEGIETLNLSPSFLHDMNDKEYLRIGVDPEDASGENGTISLVIVHFLIGRGCDALQICLMHDEIDIVIKALQRAKERMEKLDE